ncbi:MAG: succinyl-CoA:benzylsuccinate CoA-transferase [Peptococcaceae bacterium BRH_c4a]|nr:MAG: succinyl-CoA:benzylsuccinate CoA-transferase [Peptococcaceae bacterium BRH_c4a]
MAKKPLEGIRVTDFSWVGAGPITTRFLAEYGAEVIRIETKKRPEILRLAGPYKDGIPGTERSGYYSNRNPNKKSISLDMQNPRAREVVVRLIEKSDLVINNFRPGVMEKWKLGYEDVKKIKPDIIFVTMSMQGSTGPHSNYMGFGATLNALVGFNHLSGFPDKEPFGTGTNYTDHVAVPTHTAYAVVAALRHRRKTGEGMYIEMPQSEAAISVSPLAVMDYAVNGNIQTRMGNRHLDTAPHGVYKVKGERRWIAIAVFGDNEWKTLKDAMGSPSWAEDGKYATNENRLKNQDELDEKIEEWTAAQNGGDLTERLVNSGVRAGLLYDAKEVLEDRQLNARGNWVYLDHPEMGLSAYNNSPLVMSRTPAQLHSPAPLLGQHTEEVLKGLLQMSDDEFNSLKTEGILD